MEEDRARGRPLKGQSKRVRITLWAGATTVERIEKIAELRKEMGGKSCSRSDIYEEAALQYLEEQEQISGQTDG